MRLISAKRLNMSAIFTSRNGVHICDRLHKLRSKYTATTRQKRIAWRISQTFQGDNFPISSPPCRRNLLDLWCTTACGLIIVTPCSSRYRGKSCTWITERLAKGLKPRETVYPLVEKLLFYSTNLAVIKRIIFYETPVTSVVELWCITVKYRRLCKETEY